jgi:hypothetical protein
MDRFGGWIDRADRQNASYPAILVLAEGKRLPVTITNISKDGCQVECLETLPIGQSVRIELAGNIETDACVRWALLGRAGLRFGPPLQA